MRKVLLFALCWLLSLPVNSQSIIASYVGSDSSAFSEYAAEEFQNFTAVFGDSAARRDKMFGRWFSFWGSRGAFDQEDKDSLAGMPSRVFDMVFRSYTSFCLGNGYRGSWRYTGPFYDNYGKSRDSMGRVTALWVHPTDTSFILAGAAMGGIWKTTDGGRNWHNITDGIDQLSMPGTLGISHIQVDPANHDRIYAATGTQRFADHWSGTYTMGLIFSQDGGESWYPDLQFRTITNTWIRLGWSNADYSIFKMDYTPTGELIVVTSFQVLLKRSAAHDWEDITPAHFATMRTADSMAELKMYERHLLCDFEFTHTSANANKAVFTTTQVIGSDIQYIYYYDYVTHTWGSTRTLNFPIPAAHESAWILDMGVTAQDSLVFVKYSYLSSNHDITKKQLCKAHYSTGNAYVKRESFLNANTLSVYPSATDENKLYFLNASGNEKFISRSEDGGKTEITGFGITHADGRCLVYYKEASGTSGLNDVLFCGTDGGVAKKRAGSSTFHSLSGKGLHIATFYGHATSPSNDRFVVAGAQDNGTQVYIKDRTRPWTIENWGDGLLPAFSRNGTTHAYTQEMHYFHRNLEFNFGSNSVVTGSTPTPPGEWTGFGTGNHWMRPVKFNAGNELLAASSFVAKKTNPTAPWSYLFGQVDLNTGDPKTAYNLSTAGTNPNNVRSFKRVSDFELPEGDPAIGYIAYKHLLYNDIFPMLEGVLFRSKNANNWQASGAFPAWTMIKTKSIYMPITDIEVDHNHPNKLWVAYGGANGDLIAVPPYDRKEKVYYSDNYGDTFKDISRGLPPMPILKLELVPGSDNVLFAATDMGVYRWNEQQQQWECFNEGMPTCVVTDIEYLPCSGKLRVSTYGRGMWESPAYQDKNSYGPNVTHTITTNTVWNSSRTIDGSILVKNGATLTISGSGTSIYMPLHGEIKVEKNAKLVVDGARITNDCDSSRWWGIRLKGDIAAAPLPANMGTLELKNGAIIENAHTGVQDFWSPDGMGGGIIKAENSTFRNCWKAVGLNNYPDYDRADNCYFINVDFLITDNTPMEASISTLAPHQFTCWRESGVRIEDCSFKDERALPTSQLSTGIHGSDFGFRVFNTDFSYLRRGIETYNTFLNPYAPAQYVIGNTFGYIQENVTLSGHNARVYNNTFSRLMPEFPLAYPERRPSWAVYIEGPYGSSVESNTITGHPGTTYTELASRLKLGIIYKNTDGPIFVSSNTAMKNEMENLERGVQTEGMNQHLKVNCNDFVRNRMAFSINPETGSLYTSGIAPQNGTCMPSSFSHSRPNNTFRYNIEDIHSWMTIPALYFQYYVNPAALPAYIPSTVIGGANVLSCSGLSGTDANIYCNLMPITDGWTITKLNNVLQSYTNAKSQGEDVHIRFYFSEVVNGYAALRNLAGMKQFLITESNPVGKVQLAAIYLHEGNYTAMTNVLTNLTGDQGEDNALVTYFTLLKDVKQSNRSYYELTNQEKTTLTGLAASEYYIANAAKGMLAWFCDVEWEHIPEDLPLSMQRPGIGAEEEQVSVMSDPVPNPTNGTTIIRIDLSMADAAKGAELRVTTIEGRPLSVYQLRAGINEVVISLGNEPAGTYICSLYLGGNLRGSKKVVKR